MQIIPLDNTLPNQTFTVLLNGAEYRVTIRTIQGFTFMSAWIDDEPLFYNQLCSPNNWVNPYNYVSQNGKFYFECLDDNYPTYTRFGIDQRLIFYTPEEVAQL